MSFSGTLRYGLYRWLLGRRFLTAHSHYFNTRFTFRVEDAGGRGIYKRGAHERLNTDFLCQHLHLHNGDVCIDVGANLGWYSVLLAKIAEPAQCTVYAFEPDPLNYGLLQNNIAQNHCQHSIIATRAAVADRNGEQTLYLYPNKNRGRHSCLPVTTKAVDAITVPAITLDDFCAQRGVATIKLLKIDIEGFEYFALLGARAMLARTQCVMMEYSPALYHYGFDKADIIELLSSYGFVPYQLRNGELCLQSNAALLACTQQIELFWLRDDVFASGISLSQNDSGREP